MVLTASPSMICPQRGQIALPSLNVGVPRGSQRSNPGRGQTQSCHSARGTMRKVQSFPSLRVGTTGNAAMLASGFPFFETIEEVGGERNIQVASGAGDGSDTRV